MEPRLRSLWAQHPPSHPPQPLPLQALHPPPPETADNIIMSDCCNMAFETESHLFPFRFDAIREIQTLLKWNRFCSLPFIDIMIVPERKLVLREFFVSFWKIRFVVNGNLRPHRRGRSLQCFLVIVLFLLKNKLQEWWIWG